MLVLAGDSGSPTLGLGKNSVFGFIASIVWVHGGVLLVGRSQNTSTGEVTRWHPDQMPESLQLASLEV